MEVCQRLTESRRTLKYSCPNCSDDRYHRTPLLAPNTGRQVRILFRYVVVSLTNRKYNCSLTQYICHMLIPLQIFLCHILICQRQCVCLSILFVPLSYISFFPRLYTHAAKKTIFVCMRCPQRKCRLFFFSLFKKDLCATKHGFTLSINTLTG